MLKSRKKSGFPLQWGDSAGAAHHQLLLLALAPLSRRLCDARPAIAPFLSETVLAQAIIEFQIFLEANLGRDSPRPQHKVKFPAVLYKDFRDSGSLYLILDAILEHVRPQLSFDGRDPSRAPQLWAAYEAARTALVQNGFLPKRRIFFAESVPAAEVSALTAIAASHDAQVVAARDEATLVVEWDSNVDGVAQTDASEEYVRTLDIRRAFDSAGGNEGAGSQALVHWWYHPDSYDEWIPAADVDNNEMPELTPDASGNGAVPGSSLWTVCCRYLRDLDLFNEWCNELDYEVDVTDAAQRAASADDKAASARMRASKGRGKRKASASTPAESGGSLSRRQVLYAPVLESSGATEKAMNDVPPPSCASSRTPHGADAPSYSVLSVTCADDTSASSCKLSTETAASVWGAAGAAAARTDLGEADVKRPRIGGAFSLPAADGKSGGISTTLTSGIAGQVFRLSTAVPSWFKADSVSSVELRYLPEFFDSSSRTRSPDTYMSIRSYICNLYAQNSSIYLSATDCRRKIAGDAGSIIHIHSFLDSFGVINYAVAQEARPPMSPVASLAPLGGPTMFPVHRAEEGSLLGIVSGARPKWDAAADAALAASVLRHGEDWAAVAKDMTASSSAGITAEDCIVRFAQMPLQSGSEAAGQAPEGSMDVDDVVSSAAHPAHINIQKLLNEYIGARLAAVEEKVKLLASAEAVLTMEQRRLDLERRDLQVQRAQFSYAQQQAQLGGMAALP